MDQKKELIDITKQKTEISVRAKRETEGCSEQVLAE